MSVEAVQNIEAEEVEVAEVAPKMKKRVINVTKDAALTILAESNPKRADSASFDRFEGYMTNPAPTTVAEALENGLTMGDIHYDIIHGSISVEGAEVDEYMPKPRGPRKVEEEIEVDAEESDLF